MSSAPFDEPDEPGAVDREPELSDAEPELSDAEPELSDTELAAVLESLLLIVDSPAGAEQLASATGADIKS